ncbi:hypothetical protein AMJ47_02375 [Parcubacteria bacterium DG_72]|nr:MAG: hypothetical protein AMJ47_02375 [Parcubacteria bacterium DG_72]
MKKRLLDDLHDPDPFLWWVDDLSEGMFTLICILIMSLPFLVPLLLVIAEAGGFREFWASLWIK